MSTDLIKLLVSVEESGCKPQIASRPSNTQKKFFSSRNLPTVSESSGFYSKEKQARRALRSKITKILQDLPHHCEKEEQKKFSTKWAEKKKRFYEVNKQRLIKGKDPLTKLNLSTDSEGCENECFSAKEVLLRNLKENELVLLSDDPLYFIHDKKLFKSNVENDWDQILKNDPKDEENQRKVKKNQAQIDFLKEPEGKCFKDKTKKKKKPEVNYRTKPLAISKSPDFRKTLKRPEYLQRASESSEKIQVMKNIKSLPNIEKILINKKNEPKIVLREETKPDPLKPFEEFLKVTSHFEERLRYSLIKSAENRKLNGVKNLLKKWESRTRVSL